MSKQKINKLLIGTNNKGKLREIKNLLPKYIKIQSTTEFNLKSPRETGKTFRSNSELKANFFYKKSNLVSLSDDSGLEVESLNGEPGIFSSRFADDLGGFNNAMIKILEKIKKSFDKKNKSVSIADLIVLAGNAGIQKAAKKGGHKVKVPFLQGRGDAKQDQTDIFSFGLLEPLADGFVNYQKASSSTSPEEMLIDKANPVSYTHLRAHETLR